MVNMNSMTEELKKELAFTEEDLKELEQARKMPVTFDEDCPEISPENSLSGILWSGLEREQSNGGKKMAKVITIASQKGGVGYSK